MRLISLFALSWLNLDHMVMNKTVQIGKESVLILEIRVAVVFKLLDFVRVKIWALLWGLRVIASTGLGFEFGLLFLELVSLGLVVLIRGKGLSYFSKCACFSKFFTF